jgi:hypothetical protein
MTDGIGGAEDGMEPAGPDAVVDGCSVELEAEELIARHDAALAAGETGDQPVWGHLTAHIAV